MECKVQKQQCMNHGDLHSPPHFVIPFEISFLLLRSSNSKLLEVYTIVKVYTEEAKKLLPFYSPKATRAWSDNHTRERWRMCIMWRSVVERAKRARHCVLKRFFNLATTIKENFVVTYLSITTGSEGVSFRLPQDFFSQHRLERKKAKKGSVGRKMT